MSDRNKFLKILKQFFIFFKKLLTFNITTIMFGALFLYMLITVFLYATSSHVTSYQVTVGPLTKNPVCTALAIREEQIVEAGGSGYTEYYAREGMQVRKEGAVYGLDNNQKEASDITLTDEQLEKMRSSMAKFSYGFDGNNFYDTYSFKYELQGTVLQSAGVLEQGSQDEENSLEENTQEQDGSQTQENEQLIAGQPVGSAVPIGSQTVYTAPEAGVIVYSTDGYESKTPDTLVEDDFNQKSYQKTELLTSDEVQKGDPVYKVITSEKWTLMVPLTDKLAATIADRTSIKVKFLKDGEAQNGALSIVSVGNQKVAEIQLQNGMVRYASDRFLEIELVVNTQSGLKLPVSSIVSKEFFLVPRDFLTKGDNGEGSGFLKELESSGSSVSTEFVDAAIYKEVDADGNEITSETSQDSGGYCYVDTNSFQEGDVLKKPDSSETFVVGEIDYLEGVYGMNKGYAVFRQIEILDQNEEYCIVAEGTSYGLQAFDYIVLEGESVKEEEIFY